MGGVSMIKKCMCCDSPAWVSKKSIPAMCDNCIAKNISNWQVRV